MHPNPRKTAHVRDLGALDVSALVRDVLAIDEATWSAEDQGKPNRFDALDRTQHIVFRFVDSTRDWRSSHDRPAWTAWKDRLLPVMDQATAPYAYANAIFPRVMLARMAPGGVIHPHIDANPAAKWPHKVHVPLLTNPGVEFMVAGDVYHFPVGRAVEVNNLAPHAVRNTGDTHRIHLIFECYDPMQPDPDWIG